VPAGKGGIITAYSELQLKTLMRIHCMRVFRLKAASTKMDRRFDDVSAATAEVVIDI
jgi:hypothetical protein